MPCTACRRCRHRRGHGISILVPFQAKRDSDRDQIWRWLKRYWRRELPGAQIIMGHAPGKPFSKTAAVNAAAKRAKGDILVILDADAYLPGSLLTSCAHEIRHARRRGRPLWFVPYRRFYRLSPQATWRVLTSSPRHPYRLPNPPPRSDLDLSHTDAPSYGHHYAAMVMVMPREAFEQTGGMDPRFRGWGGEDISFMRAMDTIYSPHKTCDHAVFHLYHEKFAAPWGRRWAGQVEQHFSRLGSRYRAACGDPERMHALVQEGLGA